jgi:hypothetical protein
MSAAYMSFSTGAFAKRVRDDFRATSFAEQALERFGCAAHDDAR